MYKTVYQCETYTVHILQIQEVLASVFTKIQDSAAGNTTIGYKTCPKHISF